MNNSDVHVLIFGAELEMLELLEEVLSDAGFEAHTLSDMTGFKKAINDSDPHVLLFDEAEGGANPEEVFEALVKVQGDTRASYVILGNDADGERIARCLDADIDDFIVKPFDMDELNGRIRKGARVHQMRERMQALEPATDEQIGFEGDLIYLNLPDILMNLHQNGQTGRLYVEVTEGVYAFNYHRGELIKVRGPKGLKSRKAFFRAMRETAGSFRFVVLEKVAGRKTEEFNNLANLILSAVQEADEWPLTRDRLPQDPVAVSLTDKVDDVTLHAQTAIQPLLEGLIQSTTIDILIHACPRTDLQAAKELHDLMNARALVPTHGDDNPPTIEAALDEPTRAVER